MSRPSRIAVAVAVGLVGGCGIELEHNLDERQANEVVAALDRAGLAAEKVTDEGAGRFKIVVSRGESAQAFRVLEAHGLPRRMTKGLGEAFAEKGILPSATAERARLSASLAADLEGTLERMTGVTGARVHLALPDEDVLHAATTRARPTAAVLLHTLPGARIVEGDVRRTVASAVEGMQAADVNVVIAVDDEAAAPPELSQVGPLRVARGSRHLAVWMLTGALLAVLALALALVVGAIRMSSLRRKLRERGG